MQTEIIKDRFAEMWRRSRNDSGKSQEYMAKALGVSKKTVQNWEAGYSCPSQEKGFEWFAALGLQPLPYYLGLLYSEFGDLNASGNDDEIEKALIAYIKGCSPVQKRKMLYMLYGNHGSSPAGIMEMITAHLHTPLAQRLNIAHSIISNYEMAQAYGALINVEYVLPDMILLQKAYDNAVNAVRERKSAYSVMRPQQ